MTLHELGITAEATPRGVAVKEVVLPFVKFPGVDALLGPEMKSTGEAMGQADTFGAAFAKASLGCGTALPLSGKALITVNDSDKRAILPIARRLAELGFQLLATPGTAAALHGAGLAAEVVWKGVTQSPNVTEVMSEREVALVDQHALCRQLSGRRQAAAPAGGAQRRALLHHPHRGLRRRGGDPRPAPGPADPAGAAGPLETRPRARLRRCP